MNKQYNLVIYHYGCIDGFCSAYIAHKILGDNCLYVPLSYYSKVPKYKNKNILVVDFSFDLKIVKRLMKDGNKIYFIDHHLTALEKLADLDDKFKLLDINHSAAYLVWKFFFPDKKVPKFVKYIQDYDLWKFKYEETKYLNLALDLIPKSFNRWKKLEDKEYLKNLINKGKIINIYQNNIVKIALHKFRIEEQEIDGENYKIAYVNTNICVNEIANEIVKTKECDFAVCYNYYDLKNITKFNLRSLDTKADVSEIAKKLGGGGHRNSSGLTRKGFHNTII